MGETAPRILSFEVPRVVAEALELDRIVGARLQRPGGTTFHCEPHGDDGVLVVCDASTAVALAALLRDIVRSPVAGMPQPALAASLVLMRLNAAIP